MNTQKFSFEFFPPKTDKGIENLKKVRNELAKLNPAFFSVTYGAGGTTQDCTLDTVINIQKESGIDAAPHLSCIGSSRGQMREILTTYKNNGVKRIVA
ncbi:MAG: methylenetetrahydrofolate reductase, partial [Cocleimonas sp.]|nr:methylenetetrahydrofolate reductase [Cocleimonas sp.]